MVTRARNPLPEAKEATVENGAPIVLIVDDNDDNREVYSSYFQFRGCQVVTAVTGLEALVKAAQLQPCVILLDMGLPGMDGWEATKRLKTDEVTSRIPIIAVTAHAFSHEREKAVEAGVDLYLAKPITPGELFEIVLGFMRQRGLAFDCGESRRAV
jgi:two-component system, cell cycle response regulator DivK